MSMEGVDGSVSKGACSASQVTWVQVPDPMGRWKEKTDYHTLVSDLRIHSMGCMRLYSHILFFLRSTGTFLYWLLLPTWGEMLWRSKHSLLHCACTCTEFQRATLGAVPHWRPDPVCESKLNLRLQLTWSRNRRWNLRWECLCHSQGTTQ